jgi:predicted transporter
MFRVVQTRRSEFFSGVTLPWLGGALAAFVSILSIYWINRNTDHRFTVCPLQLTVSLPCPLCGGTTASILLASGKPLAALETNPLVAIGIPLAIAWALLWLAFGLRIATTLPPPKQVAVLLFLLCANWAYILSHQG